jgi:hypothetical protein
MSKEKREFQATTFSPEELQLELMPKKPAQKLKTEKPDPLKKSFLSPELIIRVTERIKKL